MKKVLILMSVYNGGDKILKQVETIYNQNDIDVSILIRDDGSKEDTLQILKKIKNKYEEKIKIIYGDNIGWKKSFLTLIFNSNLDYDYYGFSDQDDVWLNDKIISCINKIEENTENIPKLCHCNSLSVDEKLNPRVEQEKRKICPISHKNAFAMEYFQGCGMIWNKEAMKLIQKGKVENENISHDFWVGLIIYLFGKVYFIDEFKFYHIRYNNSESTDGNVKKGRLKRIKKIIIQKNNIYMNPSMDLINSYAEILEDADIKFLRKLKDYKKNWKNKLAVLFDKDFKRNTFCSTLLMKLTILFNIY